MKGGKSNYLYDFLHVYFCLNFSLLKIIINANIYIAYLSHVYIFMRISKSLLGLVFILLIVSHDLGVKCEA